MENNVDESIDFDFFDENPQKEQENTKHVSASKPPIAPRSAKQLSKTNGAVDDSKQSDSSRGGVSSSGSDASRDASPDSSSLSDSEDLGRSSVEHKRNFVKSPSNRSRSSSASSYSSDFSSNSSTDEKLDSFHESQSESKRSHVSVKGKRSQPMPSSDHEMRPMNPLAKPVKQVLLIEGRVQQNSEHSSALNSDNEQSKWSASCHKDNKHLNETLGDRDTKQAWAEEMTRGRGKKKIDVFIKHSKTESTNRPKTAIARKAKHSFKNQPARARSNSGTNSDSDITDVSSIETPRNEIDQRCKLKVGEGAKLTSADDGHSAKLRFKALSDGGEDASNIHDYDPDKITGLDLNILMKAVEDLEKQSRVQMNSRRVMFAPTILKNSDKSNYTFDRNQTRDIERENQRLLKEIIRQVNSGEHQRHVYRQPGSYRLTPSAVNRERDIQRIERENLALLKRLQDVKPTKSICRDNQLRAYENTVYRGVPVAALQHRPKGKRIRGHAVDDPNLLVGGRAESASSINSFGSSVRSVASSRSSRPTSAKSGFSTRRIDNRPAWSDRW